MSMDVHAPIAYAGRSIPRPRYHANDASRDQLEITPVSMRIADARPLDTRLDEAGFRLVQHRSVLGEAGLAGFTDRARIDAVHRDEIAELIGSLTGADRVLVNSPGLLRFSERSPRSGALDNSRPARFAHVDISDATASAFVTRLVPGAQVRRSAHYNIWRAISPPPQDVPLAVCDARSVRPGDLIPADAVFDSPGQPEWSFEGLVVAHHPAHRWHWYPDMRADEVLVFKTHDSDPAGAHCVPHVAFDNPAGGAAAPPRASLEMRAVALWLD